MTRRIDVFLQYYKPHVSGLTNMAAELAELYAHDSFDVHVHCVAKAGDTTTEVVNGVLVHSYKRSFSIGRGNFSFALLRAAWKLRRVPGIGHYHLPLPESGLFALFLKDRPSLVTYHCDAPLGDIGANIVARALDISHRILIRRANVVCTSSQDYADHSRLQPLFTEQKSIAIPATSTDRAGGARRFAVDGRRQIGFLGRPTSEKGIDVLMDALDGLPADVLVTLAGPLDGLSERVSYDRARLETLMEHGRVRALGFLDDDQIPDFYASLDLFVLPSTNSFEAFGIVQVEAMSAGVPVVVSNLPGTRTIVQATGFGEIAEVGDAKDLERAIRVALDSTYDEKRARVALESHYLPPVPQSAYLGLVTKLLP